MAAVFKYDFISVQITAELRYMHPKCLENDNYDRQSTDIDPFP